MLDHCFCRLQLLFSVSRSHDVDSRIYVLRMISGYLIILYTTSNFVDYMVSSVLDMACNIFAIC